MPFVGSAMRENGGQNQKWPTSGQILCVSPTVWGVLNALERGTKSEMAHTWVDGLCHPSSLRGPNASRGGTKSAVAHKWADWLCHPYHRGIPNALDRGTKSELAHKWADSPLHPCHLGVPQCLKMENKITNGPPTSGQIGYVTRASKGSPMPLSGGQNQQWPTSGWVSYVTPTLRILSPAKVRRGLPRRHGWSNECAHLPVLILSPTLRRRGPPKRQG